MSHHIPAAVSDAPLFATLSRRALARVDSLMTPAHFADGQVLCHEGHAGREAFLIATGTAAVSRGDTLVAEVGSGDLIGEQSLLTGAPRNATVTAEGPITAYVMSVAEFSTLMSIPGVAAAVRAVADQRALAAVA